MRINLSYSLSRIRNAIRLMSALGLVLLTALNTVQANTAQLITVKFKMQREACHVVGGWTGHHDLLEINFGNAVGINHINGSYEKAVLPYNIGCNPGYFDRLRMNFEYTGASFDKNLVQTSNEALGVRFLSNGAVVTAGEWFRIDGFHVPRLEAVLVRKPGAKLQPGKFTAVATLQIDYD